ncbi:MAG: 16S rRNA (uracil(1498)-N(3))-methyltransferase [Nitrosomonas sp.]
MDHDQPVFTHINPLTMPPRFYCNHPLTINETILLPSGVSHHAAHVLRLKKNNQVILFNGQGGEFTGQIEQIDKNGVTVQIQQFHDINRESPVMTELAQAICTNEKMDWIIQKAVEVGVNRIQPIMTNRCIVHLHGEKVKKRAEHWQQIIHSACEQCGKNKITELLPLVSYTDWLSQFKNSQTDRSITSSTKLMLTPTAQIKLSELQPNNKDFFILLVGPEGGLTLSEEKLAITTGFIPIRLGQRTLRTESAGLAALASIQALWGDY